MAPTLVWAHISYSSPAEVLSLYSTRKLPDVQNANITFICELLWDSTPKMLCSSFQINSFHINRSIHGYLSVYIQLCTRIPNFSSLSCTVRHKKRPWQYLGNQERYPLVSKRLEKMSAIFCLLKAKFQEKISKNLFKKILNKTFPKKIVFDTSTCARWQDVTWSMPWPNPTIDAKNQNCTFLLWIVDKY